MINRELSKNDRYLYGEHRSRKYKIVAFCQTKEEGSEVWKPGVMYIPHHKTLLEAEQANEVFVRTVEQFKERFWWAGTNQLKQTEE